MDSARFQHRLSSLSSSRIPIFFFILIAVCCAVSISFCGLVPMRAPRVSRVRRLHPIRQQQVHLFYWWCRSHRCAIHKATPLPFHHLVDRHSGTSSASNKRPFVVLLNRRLARTLISREPCGEGRWCLWQGELLAAWVTSNEVWSSGGLDGRNDLLTARASTRPRFSENSDKLFSLFLRRARSPAMYYTISLNQTKVVCYYKTRRARVLALSARYIIYSIIKTWSRVIDKSVLQRTKKFLIVDALLNRRPYQAFCIVRATSRKERDGPQDGCTEMQTNARRLPFSFFFCICYFQAATASIS